MAIRFFGVTLLKPYFLKVNLIKLTGFFNTNNFDQKKLDFLHTNSIQYLFFVNKLEKANQFNPQEKDYLKQVFQQGQTEIYKVE